MGGTRKTLNVPKKAAGIQHGSCRSTQGLAFTCSCFRSSRANSCPSSAKAARRAYNSLSLSASAAIFASTCITHAQEQALSIDSWTHDVASFRQANRNKRHDLPPLSRLVQPIGFLRDEYDHLLYMQHKVRIESTAKASRCCRDPAMTT